jgi:hypothetical protein
VDKAAGRTADLFTSLRSGRGDNGKGRYGSEQRSKDGQTAGPSTALRFGRDDKGDSGDGPVQKVKAKVEIYPLSECSLGLKAPSSAKGCN